MTHVTITHDADGTSAEGTTRGDDASRILRGTGRFLWSGRRGVWVLNSTWSWATRDGKVRAVEAALRAAGIEVTVERGDSAPAIATAADVAAREQARATRTAERVERRETYADRLAAASDAAAAEADRRAAVIPFGQPILAGHHSEGRDRRYRAGITAQMHKAIVLDGEARETARLAESATAAQRQRESLPTTLRRIDGLEAKRRAVQRQIDGVMTAQERRDVTYGLDPLKAATGERLDVLTARAAELDAELDYWRGHVAALQEQGERVWTRDDFTPGDWALVRGGRWMPVVKVNAKTLALQPAQMPWPLKYPYAEVRGRKAAADVPSA